MNMPRVTGEGRQRELVDDRVGIIRAVAFPPKGGIEPTPPWICQATLSHYDFIKRGGTERAAVGKGRTRDQAVVAAIGEAVERYCASHRFPSALHRAPLAKTRAPAIAPPEFVLYSEQQYRRRKFPYRKWSEGEEIAWFQAVELPGETPVDVPAGLVYLGDDAGHPADVFCQTTSNGLAAGPSWTFAALHGLCEVIERDGFLIHWLNRMPAPEVDFAGTPGLASDIWNHYRQNDVEIRVFNLTCNLPAYVMMAISLEAGEKVPRAIIGLGCHLDPARALMSAFYEICQIRPGLRDRYLKDSPEGRFKQHSDVLTIDDHSLYAAMPGSLPAFDFLLRNGRKQALEDLPNHSSGEVERDLKYCTAALASAGYRVCCANLTTDDVAECGWQVVRMLVTGLQPISFGHGRERLGGRRLFEVPASMGYAVEPATEAMLNPFPHPLA